MTITSVGYDGTVNEGDWADLAALVGRDYAVGRAASLRFPGDVDDWAVTKVTGVDRTVQIAAGRGYGHGVLDVSDAPVNVQLPTLGAGTRWDTIVMRRDWSGVGGASSFTFVTGTSAQAIAAGVNSNPGVLDDQVIALVQITAGQQVPTQVIDLRQQHSSDILPIPNEGSRPATPYEGQTIFRKDLYAYEVWADGGWKPLDRPLAHVRVGGGPDTFQANGQDVPWRDIAAGGLPGSNHIKPPGTLDMWRPANPTRLYAPVKGLYLLRQSFAYSDQNGNYTFIAGRYELKRNGAPIEFGGTVGYGGPGFVAGPHVTSTIGLDAGDYVTISHQPIIGASSWVVRHDTNYASLTLIGRLP